MGQTATPKGKVDLENVEISCKEVKVESICVRGCFLPYCSSPLARMGSSFTSLIVGPLEHWWVKILLEDKRFLILQWSDPNLELLLFETQKEVDARGLQACGQTFRKTKILTKSDTLHFNLKSTKENFPVKDICDWLIETDQFKKGFSVTKNNCQRLSKAFFEFARRKCSKDCNNMRLKTQKKN